MLALTHTHTNTCIYRNYRIYTTILHSTTNKTQVRFILLMAMKPHVSERTMNVQASPSNILQP